MAQILFFMKEKTGFFLKQKYVGQRISKNNKEYTAQK